MATSRATRDTLTTMWAGGGHGDHQVGHHRGHHHHVVGGHGHHQVSQVGHHQVGHQGHPATLATTSAIRAMTNRWAMRSPRSAHDGEELDDYEGEEEEEQEGEEDDEQLNDDQVDHLPGEDQLGSHPPDSFLDDGAAITELLNDRAWSYKVPERWADLLRDRGIEQVFDLHLHDRASGTSRGSG